MIDIEIKSKKNGALTSLSKETGKKFIEISFANYSVKLIYNENLPIMHFENHDFFIFSKSIPKISIDALIQVAEKIYTLLDKTSFEYTGQYFFFVIDKKEGRAYIFRDAWGTTPIYYSKIDDFTFIFSDSITNFNKYKKGINFNASSLSEYITCSYVCAPVTVFEDIYTFCPRQMGDFNFSTFHLNQVENIKFPTINNLSFDSVVSSLDKLLKVSLKNIIDCYQSDFKYYLSLSGGNDSSLLAAMIKEICPSLNLMAGCVDYENWHNNDTEFFHYVADKLKLSKHLESINNQNYADGLVNLIKSTSNIYHTFSPAFTNLCDSLSKLSDRKFSVHLNGTGPDECMVGFEKLSVQELLSLNKVPKSEWVDKLIGSLDYFYTIDQTIQDLFLEKVEYKSYRKMLANRAAENAVDFVDFQRKYAFETITDHHIKMIYDITRSHNQMTYMPFCTQEIFNLTFSTPFTVLNGQSKTKLIIKELLKKYFTEDFILRKKIGFHAPSRVYFKELNVGMNKLITNIEPELMSKYYKTDIVKREINTRLNSTEAPMDYFLWTTVNTYLLNNNL